MPTKAEKRAAAGKDDPPSSSDSRSGRNGKKGQAWPTWLWGVIGMGVLAVVGRVFLAPPEAAPAPKGSGKKAPPSAAKKSKPSDGSTASYLELAMRLAQATEAASAIQNAGKLDSEAARALDIEMTDIEGQIEGLDGDIARDLRAMVSVVRGTMYQKTEGLTDEQVEKLGNSYTYANPRYWDDYYNKTSEEERFDWYGSWDQEAVLPDGSASTLGELMRPHLDKQPSQKTLMFGCGNSDMSAKMYKAGYEDIVNIDISDHLIEGLRAQHEKEMPKMKWQFMSVDDLKFDTGSFDITVDKGTLDAIEQNLPLLQAAIKEAHRTLKSGGVFVSVTFNPVGLRIEKQLQANAEWGECHSQSFEKPVHNRKDDRVYHVHACTKP
jgi:SAM-dependent methyltransferase